MTTPKTLAILFSLMALFAAACGGTEEASTTEVEEVAETVTTEAAVEEEASETTEATPMTGQELYEANCARCHGSDGVATRGPDLVDINLNVPEQQDSIDQITNGGNGMPSFGARLSEDEIQSMVDYIYESF